MSCKSTHWEPSRYVRTDGRTDMTLMAVFRDVAAVPKNVYTRQ